MDPTEEAALTVLDIVSSCVEVSILAVQALDESVARWVFRMRAHQIQRIVLFRFMAGDEGKPKYGCRGG